MNKRTDFRISLDNKRCLLSSNIYVPEAKIENISGTGMSIVAPLDALTNVFDIQFSIHGRSFLRQALIERKEALPCGQTTYALSFVGQTDPERVYLHSVLMTEAAISLQEKKAISSQ